MRPVSLILLLAVAAGCGRDRAPPEPMSSPISGQIDAGLPPELRRKQEALGAILDALVGGLPWEQLPGRTDRLWFDESRDEFYERNARSLVGWQFDGRPHANDVPVLLLLTLDDAGRHRLQVHRVYAVAEWPDQITIRRRP